MITCKGISISKPFEIGLNEDAIRVSSNLLAISDGAGGGGLFAEKWSNFLVEKLPHTPIRNWEDFDNWLSNIWEEFYRICEDEAKRIGSIAIDKFYSEGAFATLAAIWIDYNKVTWISYGDTVVFHYSNKELTYSIDNLNTFNNPPALINCKDNPSKSNLKYGEFKLNSDSVIFLCSDALAHYLLMLYEIDFKDIFVREINEGLNSHSRNSTIIKSALSLHSLKRNSFEIALNKLISSCKNRANFIRHIKALIRRNLINLDDYTFAYVKLS